jgi:hypothetical protein
VEEETEKQEAPSSEELLEQLRDSLSKGIVDGEKFTRLFQAIAGAKGIESERELSCEECREELDILVADQLAGHDVAQRHPTLFAHLNTCKECRVAYLLLLDILMTERDTPSPAVTSPPVKRSTPWRREGALFSPSLPLTFHIARDFFAKLLRGPQLAFARGASAEDATLEREGLLLYDIVPFEQGDLIVEFVTHRRLSLPQVVDLEIRLVSDWSLPSGLQIHLTAGDIQRLENVDGAGRAWFRELPVDHLLPVESDPSEAELTLTFVHRSD